MSGSTYRVEEVMVDPSGDPRMERHRGTPYPTLIAATEAATRGDHGPLWIIVEERVVSIAPAVEAIMLKNGVTAEELDEGLP